MSDSIGRSMWRGFLIGLASGLGAALGATILLGLLIYILSRIDFIPFLGDYIRQIVSYLSTHPR